MRIVISLLLAELSSEQHHLNSEITKEKILRAAKAARAFKNGSPIPTEFAFGRIDPIHHFAFSQNRDPQLEWKDVPEPTKSFTLICYDVDVPRRSARFPLLFFVLSSFTGFSWISPTGCGKVSMTLPAGS
jgi:phosphatidylethanolamine-binding protein (PEBP) family uncharacterized protein